MAKREVIVTLRLEDQNAVQRLGKLEIETKQYQQELRALNAEIRANGTATREQTQRVGELSAKIRSNQTVIRELKNDLSGATDAGLRFRDKMADAAKAGLGAFGLNLFGAAAAVTAFVGVIRGAAQTITGFEQANANLASILGVSKDQIGELTDSAIALGPALGRLPQEVTDLQTELAKLGFTTPQILEAQEAVILLANATGESLGKSAEVAAATLKGFGLDADQTQRVVDVMAQSFNATSLDLEKFSTAMATLAPAAKAAGFSFEETTALVGVLADRGLDASVVGTSLRSIFQDLAKTGMTLDEALAQINNSSNKNATAFELFGERAASAGIILAETREETDRVTTSLQAAGGAAETMARTQLDTLSGSVKQLSAAWDGFILSIEKGDGALGAFVRNTIDGITALINKLSGVGNASVEDFTAQVQQQYTAIGGTLQLVAESGDEVVDRYRLINEEVANYATSQQNVDMLEARANITRRELLSLQQQLSKEYTEENAIRAAAAQAVLNTIRARQQAMRVELQSASIVTEAGEAAVDANDKATASVKRQAVEVKNLQESYLKFIDEINSANFERLQVRLPETTPQAGPVGVEDPQFFEQELQGTEDLYTAKRILMENYYIRLNELKREDFATEQEYTNAKATLHRDYIAGKQQLEDEFRLQVITAAAGLADALAGLAAQGSAEQKAFAIAAAIANTYVGVTKALAELKPPLSFITAATVVAQGLAAVQRIRNTNPEFAEGGYTSPGPKYKPAGTVHAGEWVAPAWQVNSPTYGPLIEWLEQQRMRRSSGPIVPYVTGGMVAAATPSMTAQDIATVESNIFNRLALDRPMQVDVVEINKAQGRVRVADTLATA